jgi:hypothetical protein
VQEMCDGICDGMFYCGSNCSVTFSSSP